MLPIIQKMPVLQLVLKSDDIDPATGDIQLVLHNNIKAQNARLTKIVVNKSASSSAGEYRLSIQLPEIFHECFSTARHACFEVPHHHNDHYVQLDYNMSLGIQNLPNILKARIFNQDGSLVKNSSTNSSKFKEITIYIDYQTNDIF